MEELRWLGESYRMVKEVLTYLRVDEIATAVEAGGFQIYAMVVTGAAEDIKTLLEDPLVRSVALREVVFRR